VPRVARTDAARADALLPFPARADISASLSAGAAARYPREADGR